MTQATPPAPAAVEAWIVELGLAPTGGLERVDRDGVAAWDLRLDGRRRFDIRATLIVDPATAAIVWVHLAPPISDSFRVSYRKLLRWNDEFPFAKFALTDDDRPVLAIEIPVDRLDRDELGLGVTRLLEICDLLLEETAPWAWTGGRIPDWSGRVCRQEALFARYAGRLGELDGRD